MCCVGASTIAAVTDGADGDDGPAAFDAEGVRHVWRLVEARSEVPVLFLFLFFRHEPLLRSFLESSRHPSRLLIFL